jgi:hypothetical protein
MNPLNETDVARRQAPNWSGRLGNLAAASPAIRPEAAFPHIDTAPPAALPARLSAILNYLQQRHQRRQRSADKHRAQEFVMAP